MVVQTCSTRTPIPLVLFLSVLLSSAQSIQNESVFPKRTKRRNQLEHIMDFRIVGGSDASIKDFPYMISLQMSSNHICGASILTNSFILTAAHCVTKENDSTWAISDPLEYNIVAGQTVLDLGDCQFRDVKKIFVHSGYNHTTLHNDIAVLEIFGTLEWTKYVQMVEIFSKIHLPFEAHDFCTAIGWGSSEPMKETSRTVVVDGKNSLQQVDLQPSLYNTCERFFVPAPQ